MSGIVPNFMCRRLNMDLMAKANIQHPEWFSSDGEEG